VQRVGLVGDRVEAEEWIDAEVAINADLLRNAAYPVPSLVPIDITAVQVDVVLTVIAPNDSTAFRERENTAVEGDVARVLCCDHGSSV
jgi:hypothetical protein